MISLSELNPHKYPTTLEITKNLQELLVKLNVIRKAYGKPMIITSGLRSESDQQRINPKAPKSRHISGNACDVLDRGGEFWNWLMANIPLLEELGLYLEDRKATPAWVHIQTVAPKSGSRIFKP